MIARARRGSVFAGAAVAVSVALRRRRARRVAEQMTARRPMFRTDDGAGHMVTPTHAAAVNTALEDLLARVRADTAERSRP